MRSGGFVKQAEFIEDIDSIGTALGPAVVFRKLTETTSYLDDVTAQGLSEWQKNADAMRKAGILVGDEREWFYGTLHVCGWHNKAEHSTYAREQFEKLARPFFPDVPGRDGFLGDLSRTVARFAAAANARELFFTLSAEERKINAFPPDFSFESGERTRGHLQLAGSSLIIAPPEKYTGEIWQHALADELSAEDKMRLMFNAQNVKARELVAWQGRDGRYPVLSADNVHDGSLRVDITMTPVGQDAAHPFKPFFLEHLADKRRTTDFKNS